MLKKYVKILFYKLLNYYIYRADTVIQEYIRIYKRCSNEYSKYNIATQQELFF